MLRSRDMANSARKPHLRRDAIKQSLGHDMPDGRCGAWREVII